MRGTISLSVLGDLLGRAFRQRILSLRVSDRRASDSATPAWQGSLRAPREPATHMLVQHQLTYGLRMQCAGIALVMALARLHMYCTTVGRLNRWKPHYIAGHNISMSYSSQRRRCQHAF